MKCVKDDGEIIYSFLSLSWAIAADADIDSEQ